tara:strand:- start:424 stop:585 length:162 start_codon:yes stop_codon:yes gene_type:complete
MVKISITLPEEDFEAIKRFAQDNDMKISSILRKGAKELIKRENETEKSATDTK